MDLERWLRQALDGVRDWEKAYGDFEAHPSLTLDDADVEKALADLLDRLCGNYPFFHPRYAGQMLKPPHPAAIAGYLAAMLINPNNHALDGGPPTSAMEKDVVGQLAAMFGFGAHLGHLTSSGTIANLEALFVARESHPGKAIAYGGDAHYTHGRMCHVLGARGVEIPSDDAGRIDLAELVHAIEHNDIGTVVLTAGTTGVGVVDAIDDAVPIARAAGVRIHVDAAYGGFFAIPAATQHSPLAEKAAAAFRAIAHCDSVVVDRHKQGLQPYGCGAVLFADPGVGRFYQHDSPYTYFTSDELHLGEISLECSRAGAAAAALWFTTRLLPLTPDGLGAVLNANLQAARRWYELLAASEILAPLTAPTLDIVTYRVRAARSLRELDDTSARLLAAAMSANDPVFVSTLRVPARQLAAVAPELEPDAEGARVLRSVLLKPESLTYAAPTVARLEQIASEIAG